MSRHSRRVHRRLKVECIYPREPLAMERLSWKLQRMTDEEKDALDDMEFQERVDWLKEAVNYQP